MIPTQFLESIKVIEPHGFKDIDFTFFIGKGGLLHQHVKDSDFLNNLRIYHKESEISKFKEVRISYDDFLVSKFCSKCLPSISDYAPSIVDFDLSLAVSAHILLLNCRDRIFALLNSNNFENEINKFVKLSYIYENEYNFFYDVIGKREYLLFLDNLYLENKKHFKEIYDKLVFSYKDNFLGDGFFLCEIPSFIDIDKLIEGINLSYNHFFSLGYDFLLDGGYQYLSKERFLLLNSLCNPSVILDFIYIRDRELGETSLKLLSKDGEIDTLRKALKASILI